MDKKNIMIEATKYLPTDMLYGAIAGQDVRSYLINNADKVIMGDWTPDETAGRIKEAMYSKDTDEPLFKPASERGVLPRGVALDVTTDDKVDYINSFIESLPYVGVIYLSPNRKINIAEELRKKVKVMNDDFEVYYDFDGNTRTLLDEYRIILSNEFIQPTRMDKIEVLMEGTRRLREEYPDYDEITKIKISGKNFFDSIKSLPDKMDDKFMINNGLSEELATDVLYKRFKVFAEARYNSFNSKPTNVETIKVNRNENNELEATSEYIFISDDESKSMIDSKESDIDRLRNNLLSILVGIDEAKSEAALDTYGELITDTWKEVKEKGLDNDSFKTLYGTIVNNITNKTEEITVIHDNLDDAEIFLRDELKDIRKKIEGINTNFTHLYENPSRELEEVYFELIKFRNKVDGMYIGMHHEIDDVFALLRNVNIKIQYSMDNISHAIQARKQNIDDLIQKMYSHFRVLSYTSNNIEKAGIQVNIEKLRSTLERLLEDSFKENLINDSEYDNYLSEINRKLNTNDMEGIRRRY